MAQLGASVARLLKSQLGVKTLCDSTCSIAFRGDDDFDLSTNGHFGQGLYVPRYILYDEYGVNYHINTMQEDLQ